MNALRPKSSRNCGTTNWTTPTGRLLRQMASAEGDPLFVAKDVCEAHGLSNPSQALSALDDDEKNSITIADGNRGNPTALVVTEPGLYKLIARSRKPEAKAFDRWVGHDGFDDGRRVVSQRGIVRALSGAEDGKLDRYLDRLPSRFAELKAGPEIEFQGPTGPAKGREAQWLVDMLFARSRKPEAKTFDPLGET